MPTTQKTFGDVYYMQSCLGETDHNFIYGNALIRAFNPHHRILS